MCSLKPAGAVYKILPNIQIQSAQFHFTGAQSVRDRYQKDKGSISCKGIFISSESSRPALRSMHPPTLQAPKRPRRKAPTSAVHVKNAWNYTSASPHAFTALRLIMRRNNFIVLTMFCEALAQPAFGKPSVCSNITGSAFSCILSQVVCCVTQSNTASRKKTQARITKYKFLNNYVSIIFRHDINITLKYELFINRKKSKLQRT